MQRCKTNAIKFNIYSDCMALGHSFEISLAANLLPIEDWFISNLNCIAGKIKYENSSINSSRLITKIEAVSMLNAWNM